ncbi:MAG: tetratricopeptide repeat protein [Hyphomicrobiales bacterium]|nr:tetratricopeptide repeat protein [Hyphomicrobiales bacterium]
MTPHPESILRFDNSEIDSRRSELRRGGQVVPVEPQVLDLMAFLASEPGRVFSRDDIIETVWQGRIVSDSAISSRINAARQAVGDDGRGQRIIRTVPRRGFMFVPEVEVVPKAVIAAGGSETDNVSPVGELKLPDRPSIAVLPFENMSGDPEQTYFSDGITDDIITELSRYDEIFVIARQSSFAYRDASTDVQEIARQLGVQYILQGGVRRAGTRARVTAQLIDTVAGNNVWAERYDRDLEDIFAVQDELTGAIVNTLFGELTSRHFGRILSKSPDALDVYDHVLRAMILFYMFTPEDNRRAKSEAEAAVALDSRLARAHALIAWTFAVEGSLQWVAEPAASFAQALEAATNAISCDEREPWGHSALGYAEVWGNRAYDRGNAAFARSVALNPNSAHFRGWYSVGLCFAGRPEEGLEEVRLAMRLNPHYPPVYLNFLGRILFSLERYQEALPPLERVINAMPNNPSAMSLAAACYAALDRLDDARKVVERLLNASPSYTVGRVHFSAPYRRAEDAQRFMNLLRKAGLPE